MQLLSPSVRNTISVLILAVPTGIQAGEAIVLNRQAELFLHDNELIQEQSGLRLVPARLRKHAANPVLVIDRPWERQGILNYVAILHDEEEGLYRMWYQILRRAQEGTNPSLCLYAQSRDGIRWEKPELGLVAFEGSTRNNILFLDPNREPRGTPVYWVEKDYAEPDPQRRFKMLLNRWDFRGRGVGIGYSPDGIHFHRFSDGYFLDGTPGQWDAGSVRPVPAEAVVDGQMAVFYTASDHTLHDWEGTRGLGLALFQQGAFAGWRAQGNGTLLTRPLLAKRADPSLFLNAEAEGGKIVVEILDEDGKTLPGFSRVDCQPVTENGALVEVKWNGQENLAPAVARGAFRIRLHLRDATVYGFRVIRPKSAAVLF